MALIRNFQANTDLPNQIAQHWTMPLDFNNTTDEIIITRTITHFPSELYNTLFPTKATDSRPVEIFRANTIAGTNTGAISVTGNTLTDTSASFSVSPPLKGRLLRDSSSKVHRIVSNTTTTITLAEAPSNGKYIVLPDFNETIRNQENYEVDARTTVASGFISNLVIISGTDLVVKTFTQDEVANLVFMDGAGTKFLIKSNSTSTLAFFDSATPVIGPGMAILNSHVNSTALPHIDNYKTDAEALARTGTGLLDDTFYYYTGFTLTKNFNVAQADFDIISSPTTTQASALSVEDKDFGTLLYNYWPSLYRELDTTEDLKDLMAVFGFQFNLIHSLITTYRLQDAQTVFVNALLPLSEQYGLPSIGFVIGADTLRRIAKDVVSCWRLKGSKEGIALFIRMITTWDITNGTGDYSGSIQDFLPNVEALRFYSENLGVSNTRFTETSPFVAGGKFVQGLPGIVIPGFFTFREFVITISNVALYVGSSTAFTVGSNSTTMTASTANFGSNNSLVGNFLLPNQDEFNDVFEITSNTSTTITVKGIITNRNPGGTYAVLSPLNTNRFNILNTLLPGYIPFGTFAGYQFT